MRPGSKLAQIKRLFEVLFHINRSTEFVLIGFFLVTLVGEVTSYQKLSTKTGETWLQCHKLTVYALVLLVTYESQVRIVKCSSKFWKSSMGTGFEMVFTAANAVIVAYLVTSRPHGDERDQFWIGFHTMLLIMGAVLLLRTTTLRITFLLSAVCGGIALEANGEFVQMHSIKVVGNTLLAVLLIRQISLAKHTSITSQVQPIQYYNRGRLLDHVPEGMIVISESKKLIHCNSLAQRILGIAAQNENGTDAGLESDVFASFRSFSQCKLREATKKALVSRGASTVLSINDAHNLTLIQSMLAAFKSNTGEQIQQIETLDGLVHFFLKHNASLKKSPVFLDSQTSEAQHLTYDALHDAKSLELNFTYVPWGQSTCLAIFIKDTTSRDFVARDGHSEVLKTLILSFVSSQINKSFNKSVNTQMSLFGSPRLRRDSGPSNSRTGISIMRSLATQPWDWMHNEAAQSKISTARFDVRVFLYDLLSVYEVFTKKKGLSLLAEVDSRVPQYFYSDRAKLQSLLTIILGNALTSTTQGFIRIKIEHVPSQNLVLRVTVEDSGLGLSYEECKQLATTHRTETQAIILTSPARHGAFSFRETEALMENDNSQKGAHDPSLLSPGTKEQLLSSEMEGFIQARQLAEVLGRPGQEPLAITSDRNKGTKVSFDLEDLLHKQRETRLTQLLQQSSQKQHVVNTVGPDDSDKDIPVFPLKTDPCLHLRLSDDLASKQPLNEVVNLEELESSYERSSFSE